MTKEIFDVVDEEDRIIGQASRDQVHGNPGLSQGGPYLCLQPNELYLQKEI